METDIKVLQAAIVSEVNRREFERCIAAGSAAPPAGELQDLVQSFERLDLELLVPSRTEAGPAQAGTAPSLHVVADSSVGLTIYRRLRASVFGRFFRHTRVIGFVERARQRPGGASLRNLIILAVRGVVLRIPFLTRFVGVVLVLRHLPERLLGIESSLTYFIEDNSTRLRGVALQIQNQTNQAFYTQALAAQQNEQHLLARIHRLEQRVRELHARAAPSGIVTPRLPPAPSPQGIPPDLYVDFEDHFRGHPDLIRHRLQVYLPRLRANGLLVPGPVLDLGCGNGEWINLLAQEGVQARGVDTNPSMVALCKDRGLDACVGDALEYLAQQPAQSLAVLTAFHVIEHLPIDALIMLIDQARRVLKPGGMILLETPNPENLIVGACNFYIDPTHRNPLPPMLVSFLLEARGFVRVEIERHHPADPALHLVSVDAGVITPLNNLLFGPQDYAAIGYVP